MDEASRKARQLIKVTHHMTIATADVSGKPWSSPVFFVYDRQFTFYWVSFIGAVHSVNIRVRPQVAITLLGGPPDHEGDGVYIDGEAFELDDESEVEQAIQVLWTRPQESKFTVDSPADVLGDAAWRVYKAVPKEVYKRSDVGDSVNGQYITRRVRVIL
jgi:nitroimidazol reductase NimA-like FMN-containing flavoprotein (pyridoxamine 5'-phosphate oxidase superfamily)